MNTNENELKELIKNILFKYNDWLEILKLLVQNGVDLHAKTEKGENVLHIWAARGEQDTVDILDFLLESGMDVNVTDKQKRTPLHYAARFFNGPDVAEELIKRGANIDAQDANGDTALHLALKSDHVSMVELLLAHGANVNIANKKGIAAKQLMQPNNMQ